MTLLGISRREPVGAAWLGIILGTTGCGAAPEPAAAGSPTGPHVVPLDSVQLVETDAPGRGSVFSFTIPLAGVSEPAQREGQPSPVEVRS
jgi:hypothetical protein